MNKIRFNFTKKSIDALAVPQTGTITYHDINKHGLKLLVRPSGIKTFVLYRKIKGRPERITIGRYPDIAIEQARKQADVLNAKIANGINPNEERRAIRNEMTLKELFDQYLERYAKEYKKSWKEDIGQFNRYLASWSSKKLSSFRNSQIQKLHSIIGKENGHYAANRLLALLHTMFNKAIAWGWNQPNPAHGITKFKEKSRDRFIQADELPRFFQSLSEESNQTARDYIIISLLTGARRSNAQAMRWDQINFERSTWTIPETKTGDTHTIPLVPEAIEILKNRRNKNLKPWVFPSNSKAGYFQDPKKAWKRILKRAEIKDLRIHDLRRSLGSWQAATGANLSIIGKTLAHKNVSTTAIYARLNIDSVRDSMNKATRALMDAAKLNCSKKIININSKT